MNETTEEQAVQAAPPSKKPKPPTSKRSLIVISGVTMAGLFGCWALAHENLGGWALAYENFEGLGSVRSQTSLLITETMFSYYLKIIALLSITVAVYSVARQLGSKSSRLASNGLLLGLFGLAVFSMNSLTAIAVAIALVGTEFAGAFYEKQTNQE